MSLRKRIVAATIVMVLATVIVSSLVAYFATESRLGVFVEQIGDEEAVRLAQSLSRAHADAGGWQTADAVLEQAGYAYGATVQRAQTASGEENHIEVLHQDPVRVVIVDAQGSIVLDNFGQLAPGSSGASLDGHREPIPAAASNQPAGHVYVDVNRELLSTESDGFLSTLLTIILIGGLVTVGAAVLFAVWLSQRITAPVRALTEATQGRSQGRPGPAAGLDLRRTRPDERRLQPHELDPRDAARAAPAVGQRRVA